MDSVINKVIICRPNKGDFLLCAYTFKIVLLPSPVVRVVYLQINEHRKYSMQVGKEFIHKNSYSKCWNARRSTGNGCLHKN